MPQISVTRLRLRHWRFFPVFIWYALTSARQAQRTDGFRGGWLGNSSFATFWTVTAWTDEAAMRRFRDRERHKAAMPRLLDWCDEGAVTRWNQATDQLPDGDAALRRLLDEGRTSKVRYPSAAQHSGKVAPDGRAPRPGRQLRPVPRQSQLRSGL